MPLINEKQVSVKSQVRDEGLGFTEQESDNALLGQGHRNFQGTVINGQRTNCDQQSRSEQPRRKPCSSVIWATKNLAWDFCGEKTQVKRGP